MNKVQQFYVLTKPRVVQLIVFCSLIGMLLALPGLPSWPQWITIFWACLGITLVAAAAAVFNCLVEKIIDAKMTRTAWRPSAKGQLGDSEIALFSFLLGLLGCILLGALVNWFTMWLTLATFVGYAVIYTVFLKPTTPQNIVIGGASGAMPPVLGWAAVTNQLEPMPWLLFLIIFLWTPPHFWSLSLYRVEDYKRAGLPMLPATHGSRFTRLQILYYTLALVIISVVPVIYGANSWLYLLVAGYLGWRFFNMAWQLWRNYSEKQARATFFYSLLYLSVLFFTLLVDHYLVAYNLIGVIK